MGKIKPPEPALLFIGTLYSDNSIFNQALTLLEDNFGNILFLSPSINWNYSSYYKDELGWPIFRQFVFFEDLIDPSTLPEIKIQTNKIEGILSFENKRRINLDPGYLTLSKIVLASTKNYAHRIYLGKGIYAEITLIYKGGTYIPHIFTYKDYQEKGYIDIFLNMREKLKQMIQ